MIFARNCQNEGKYLVEYKNFKHRNKPNRMINVEIMIILIQFYPEDSDVSSITPRNMYNFAGCIGHFYGSIGGILSKQILTITYNLISESGCCNPISYLKRNTARTVVQAVSDAAFLSGYSNQSGLFSFRTSTSSLSGSFKLPRSVK